MEFKKKKEGSMRSLMFGIYGVFSTILYGLVKTLSNERGDLGGSGGSSSDKSGAESGIQAAGEQAYQRGAMTPEEQAQYQNSFQLGAQQQGLYQSGLGMQQSSSPLYQNLYNQYAQQAANPDAGWESALQPNLQLANQNVNQQANSRGLLDSGINIENMGTAGLELAIADAQNRMAYRQQSLTNSNNFAQGNIAGLSNLYGQEQSMGQNSMNRQASQAQASAQYQAYPYQAQLGGYYGTQAGNQANTGQMIGAVGNIGSKIDWTKMFQGNNTDLGGAAGNMNYGSNTPSGVQDMGGWSSLGTAYGNG
jgi:hypothetical protein